MKLNTSFPEILVTVAEQVEHGEDHEVLHLHRVRGVLGRKLTNESTIGELLDLIEEDGR